MRSVVGAGVSGDLVSGPTASEIEGWYSDRGT